MTDRPETSAVRDATDLFYAAEELLGQTPDPIQAAANIDQIARAAKALRQNHLEDALEHVLARARRVEETREFAWLTSEEGTVEIANGLGETVGHLPELEPDQPDPADLAARVHGSAT